MYYFHYSYLRLCIEKRMLSCVKYFHYSIMRSCIEERMQSYVIYFYYSHMSSCIEERIWLTTYIIATCAYDLNVSALV